MNILEYSVDMNKTKEEIMELCNKLGISYEDENSILTDDDITLLDNEIRQNEETDTDSSNEDNMFEYDYELDEKVEKIIDDAKIDIDQDKRKE